ncbi:unnamed protein product [Phytophthora lilii]|uniref:Unnamed protein product n=1 Tax=Phytophthora lilii TaxID=2077276 RepID=A0A9W6WZ53_9STRA|nr:unnamed protein product [Phytophthora lilii]
MWTFLHQASLGLEHLHERGVVHGDLRCTDGSMRWQSLEVLRGEPLSCSSDVDSLGMCIVEAVTGKVPWAEWGKAANDLKQKWAPEDESDDWRAPDCRDKDAQNLIRCMCSKDPTKRTNLSSVVQELERLRFQKRFSSSQPEREPLYALDNYKFDTRYELWEEVELIMHKCSDDFYCLAFDELKQVRKRLQESLHPATLFNRTELAYPLKYTPGQLDVLRKAYDDIANNVETNKIAEMTPKRFIPWYELIFDKYDSLGQGGYGSVFLANWLDSDVVVKRLILPGDHNDCFSAV